MFQSVLHFNIKGKIADGGMGSVYKAEDTRLDRIVALKFLSGTFSSDGSAHQRLQNEARAAAALNHPYIAQIYAIEETKEELFIVMEYVDGKDIKELIATEDLSYDEKIRISCQVGNGLVNAHEKGIIHRDIKPSNIMVDEHGDAKILDFGLARIQGSDHITKEGTTMGTAAYMSPEQAKGAEVDHRTDIWSFGVVLYQLMFGKTPFRGNYEQAILYSIVNEDPEPIPNLRSDNSEGLRQIIDRALQKDPQDRYQKMEELLEDLQALSDHPFVNTVSSSGRSKNKHSVLVGRQKECGELHAAMQRVRSGHGLLVCAAGEAGIGKTTLVETFLTQLAGEQGPEIVVWGRCSERLAGTEAFMPFIEILEGLIKQNSDESLDKLMKEKAPFWYQQVDSSSGAITGEQRFTQQDKAVTKERMKREMSTFLKLASKSHPLVFFIEDLHWADISTIDLIDYIANRFGDMRLLIVTTYRPNEMVIADHPFLDIRPDLLSHGLCQELKLGFLNSKQVGEYLREKFSDNDFSADFVQLIHQKTGGNPLFMVNLVGYLEDQDVIVKKEGQWTLDKSLTELQIKLPDSVKSMIQRKIDHLDEEKRHILNVAAIQGDEFDSAVLHQVMGISATEVEDQLQLLERHYGFIRLIEENELPDRSLNVRYKFVHILYQNVLYELLSLSRRASLSRQAAEALVGFYGEKTQKVASELARLFESAREYEQAIDYYFKASQNAQRIFAYHESLKFQNQVLKLIEYIRDDHKRLKIERDILIEKAITLVYIKGYSPKDVRDICNRVRELSKKLRLATPSPILRTLAISNLTVCKLEESYALGEEILANAKRNNNHKELVEAHYVLGATVDRFGNFTKAIEHFEEAVTKYEHEDRQLHIQEYGQDPFVICKGRLALALWKIGNKKRAKKLMDEALIEAEQIEHPFSLSYVRFIALQVKQMDGENIEEVQKLAKDQINTTSEYGLTIWLGTGYLYYGWALSKKGQINDGIATLRKGLSILEKIDYKVDRSLFNGLLVEALIMDKKYEEALLLVEDSIELIEQTGVTWGLSEAFRRKGEILMKKSPSHIDQAKECFQKAIEVAKKQKAISFEQRANKLLSQLT